MCALPRWAAQIQRIVKNRQFLRIQTRSVAFGGRVHYLIAYGRRFIDAGFIRLGQVETSIGNPMKLLNDTQRVQSLRPRVIEIDYGLFRGYVDIQDHSPNAGTSSKAQYCRTAVPSRELAERQALELARRLGTQARQAGASTHLMCDSLGDGLAGRRELDGIPASLLRREAGRATARKHLRAVA